MTVVTSNVDGASFPWSLKARHHLRGGLPMCYVIQCTAVIEYLIEYLVPCSMVLMTVVLSI